MAKSANTVSELARREDMSRTTIYELIATGQLRARKRGRLTIITDEDWNTYLRSLPDAVACGAIRAAQRPAA